MGAGIGAALILVLAVVASGPAGLGRDRGNPDHGSVAVRATLGGLLALAAALIAVVAHRVTRRDRSSAPSMTRRASVARALPWIAAAVALGAVLGAATAPRYRAGTSEVDDSTGAPVDPRLPTYAAQLATDSSGKARVQIDPDGDGRYEMLTPCPPRSRADGANEAPRGFSASPDDPILVPIDYECDGIIDAYARLESFRFQPAGPERGGGTTPGAGELDADGNPVDGTVAQIDGRYYLDSDGVVRLYLDLDGDGTYETPTERCRSGASRPPSSRRNDPLLAPIDVDCDGTIDAYARVESTVVERNPAGPYRGSPGLAPDDVRPPGSDDPSRGGTAPGTTAVEPPEREPDDGDRGTSLLPAVLLVALIGAVLAVAVVLISRRMRTPPAVEDGEQQSPVDDVAARVLVPSLEELAGSADPRTAILNTYARLLERLAEAGLPRRASETPEVYLDRCVRQLGLPREPMAELTELFSVARFSTHPVDEAQRARAAALLEQSVATLRRPAGDMTGAST